MAYFHLLRSSLLHDGRMLSVSPVVFPSTKRRCSLFSDFALQSLRGFSTPRWLRSPSGRGVFRVSWQMKIVNATSALNVRNCTFYGDFNAAFPQLPGKLCIRQTFRGALVRFTRNDRRKSLWSTQQESILRIVCSKGDYIALIFIQNDPSTLHVREVCRIHGSHIENSIPGFIFYLRDYTFSSASYDGL